MQQPEIPEKNAESVSHRHAAKSGPHLNRKGMDFDFTYLSLGAGVQSTAMLIMSALGLYGCPNADVAIFADTGDEPAWATGTT